MAFSSKTKLSAHEKLNHSGECKASQLKKCAKHSDCCDDNLRELFQTIVPRNATGYRSNNIGIENREREIFTEYKQNIL